MNLGNYTVSLTRIADGKTVEYVEGFEVHDDSTSDWSDWQSTLRYLYEDGNYSCSCNRFLFFERALGTPEEVLDKAPERDQGCAGYRYRVNFIKLADGEIIYEEKDDN